MLSLFRIGKNVRNTFLSCLFTALDKIQEILKQQRSHLARFFGMKLNPHEVVFSYNRREIVNVMA